MSAVFVFAMALVIVLYALGKVLQVRVRRYGFWVLAWRWLTGAPWHGRPVTDAGWVRPGMRALTSTGHANRWHYLPRWRRTLWRTGGTVVTLLVGYGLVAYRTATLRVLLATGVAGVAFGVWLAWQAVRTARHRRQWVKPLHLTVAPLIGVPLPNRPGSWLQIDQDRTKATLALPPGFNGTPKDREQIARTVSAKLALEAPEVRWALAGPEPAVTFLRSAPPPVSVDLEAIREAIERSRPNDLVLGIGKRDKAVKVSLSGDSPHIGLSMGSGAGKSTTARLIAAQLLHKGAILLCLDMKYISHTWAKGLPNVSYARTPEEIHEALLWLQDEVDRRNQVADAAADIEGEVHANVGPRILVIAEELNATQARLQAYWRQIRAPDDPKRSPATEALEEALFLGRQVRVHVLQIGQRLSARASGSGDARENLAVRILARHSAATWKMLVPEHPMPPPSGHLGRVQVVTSAVYETQVGFMTGKQAREMALSGTVAPCPRGMPYAGRRVGETSAPELERSGSDLGVKQPQPVSVSPVEVISLRESVNVGILSGGLAGIRTARHRRPDFPKPVGYEGVTALYDPEQLAAWEAARTRR